MTREPHDLPSTNHPLGGPPRRRLPAILALVGLALVIIALFAVITWARYNT